MYTTINWKMKGQIIIVGPLVTMVVWGTLDFYHYQNLQTYARDWIGELWHGSQLWYWLSNIESKGQNWVSLFSYYITCSQQTSAMRVFKYISSTLGHSDRRCGKSFHILLNFEYSRASGSMFVWLHYLKVTNLFCSCVSNTVFYHVSFLI